MTTTENPQSSVSLTSPTYPQNESSESDVRTALFRGLVSGQLLDRELRGHLHSRWPQKKFLERPRESDEPTASEQALNEVIIEREESGRPTSLPRSLPQDDFEIYDRLTRRSTLAQDTLGFDYVRGDGIIVDGDEYIGLVAVHPRNWLVLNDAERMAVFRAYTSFLLGLKYPIQIVSVPDEFDVSRHTRTIQLAENQASRKGESPILHHGRRRQVAWMHNTIDTMSVKDRRFYLVTRVRSAHVNASTGKARPNGSFPIIGGLLAQIGRNLRSRRAKRRKESSVSEERCVKEVRARQNELSETLTKTGVGTRIVSDRDEAMDILYRHYNHVESPFTTYNHATYTRLLSDGPTGTGAP